MIKRKPPIQQPPVERDRKQCNEGRLQFAEQYAFDTQRYQPARDLSHRGGLGPARTEHY